MKKIIYILFLLIIFTQLPSIVRAADLEIDCDGKNCLPESTSSLFSSNEQWTPGMWKSKIITIKNLDDKNNLVVDNKAAGFSTDNSPCQFEKKFMISITRLYSNSPNNLVWSGSLYDFYNISRPIVLSTFEPNSAGDFKYIISFNQDSGDECQGKTASFNLQLGFVAKSISKLPQDNKNTINNISSNTCTDNPPITAPILNSVTPGINSVILNWTKPSDLFTYYYITYGSSKNHKEFSNPNAGTKDTTTYAVTGLDEQKPYYFTVAAGNGCALGPASSELSAIPLRSVTTPQSLTGSPAKVLGASTSNSQHTSNLNVNKNSSLIGFLVYFFGYIIVIITIMA